MKKIYALFLILFTITFAACDNEDVVPQDCFEVKMIRSYCTGDAVLQIITPAAQSFGETWTDHDGQVFKNVFRTILPCDFDYDAAQNEQSFSITLNDNSDGTDICVRCAMFVTGLPEKLSYITPVSGCGNTVE